MRRMKALWMVCLGGMLISGSQSHFPSPRTAESEPPHSLPGFRETMWQKEPLSFLFFRVPFLDPSLLLPYKEGLLTSCATTR